MVGQRKTADAVRPSSTDPVWPVCWSGVWVGALAAVAAGLIFGLIGIALGAQQITPGQRIADWSEFGVGALVFSVAGTFFAFVIGGWAAARVAGVRRAETAILHGAIAWLVAVPILLVLASAGAATYSGAWYGGLAGTPPWAASAGAPVDPNAAVAARNGALGAVTALLLGLVGAVIGGWMASGEPMTPAYYRVRDRRAA